MNSVKKIILIVASILFISPLYAVKSGGHVKASLVSEIKSIQPGTPFWVAIRLEMQPKWHTYWKNPGDSGAPTEVTWQLPQGFHASPLTWPRPEVIALPPIYSYGYENEVLLLSQITPPSVLKQAGPITLKAHVDWLECEVVCIPGQADVSLTLPVKITSPAIDVEWQKKFSETKFEWTIKSADWNIKAFTTENGYQLRLSLMNGTINKPSELYFFSEDANIISYGSPQKITIAGGSIQLDLIKSEATPDSITALRGVIVNKEGWRGPGSEKSLAVDVPLSGPAPTKSSLSFGLALLFSFIGGLILNLMPCVLPVLSIKILGFVKQAQEDRQTIFRHGLFFTSGVIVSFWILAGALLFLRAGGQQLGWGFQLQSPVFVGVLALVFFVLGLSLLGVFEIGTSLIQLADTTRGKTGYSNSFFSGVLATVVATPCTAPFMGPALGLALTLPPTQSLAIFTSLGLGMSSPYLILSAHPAFLKFVPKPGPWMDQLKKIMGLLFMLTVAWLLWVLSTQLSAHKSSVTSAANTNAIKWETYSSERVESLRKEGRPVFVDFSAAWCLTCQVNERVALNSEKVQQAIKEKNIATLKADWTSHDEKITRALQSFGRSGVPFYVLYPSDTDKAPIILPEILTPQIVLDNFSKLNQSDFQK